MSSRFEQAYRVDGATKLTATLWNRIFRELDTRLVSIEEKKASFEEAERQLLQIGLDRINEALLPAAERIFHVAELGFLVASSDEEATFVEGQEASLTIREGDQRELFTPTEFVALTRRSTPEDWVIARTLGYSRESGVLLVRAEVVKGSGGPHDDWDVSATPGAAQAVVDLFEQVSSLRQEVADDKAAVAIDKAAAQSARTDAQNARDAAIIAKTDAESALASFMTVYRGALPSAPPDGEQGHFYFDTTLQMARVYTASGWEPLFQVSLGGIRQGFFEATNGQDEFTVAGGFSYLNVWVNGVLLTPGVDYTTASPDVTLAVPLSAGDQVAYTGYYATEVTDFYSKLDADARFVRHDGEQSLTPAQKGQARANIDAGILAGFRNKIINGNFDIWQRGTSQTGLGYGSADRWRVNGLNASGALLVSRQEFDLGQTDVPGNPRYYIRIAGSSFSATDLNLAQAIEDVRTLAGRKATLTFWARASAPRQLRPLLIQEFGSGGSPSSPVYTFGDPVNVTTSWQKFSQVIDLPSIAGKVLGTDGNDYLDVTIDIKRDGVGTDLGDDTIDLARVSLVEGDATAEADPFSPRHIQQELALCQRYYYKASNAPLSYPFRAVNYSGSAGDVFVGAPHPVKMRSTPSASFEWEINDVVQAGWPNVVALSADGWGISHNIGAGSFLDIIAVTMDAEL